MSESLATKTTVERNGVHALAPSLCTIAITPEARDFIRARGGRLTLELPPPTGCCVHAQFAPGIQVGDPPKARADRFTSREVDGVTVFVDRDIPDSANLTVEMQSIFGWRHLAVAGWKLI